MTGPWLVAFVALAVCVVLLGVLVTGLLRRFSRLLDKFEGAPSTARAQIEELRAGETAPVVIATGSDSASARLVLFLDSDCESCRLLYDGLKTTRVVAEGAVDLIAVIGRIGDWTPERELRGWTVVRDRDREIYAAWRVAGTPLAYVVSADNRVVASTVPNQPAHLVEVLEQSHLEPVSHRLSR